jgi:hypothetical protein
VNIMLLRFLHKIGHIHCIFNSSFTVSTHDLCAKKEHKKQLFATLLNFWNYFKVKTLKYPSLSNTMRWWGSMWCHQQLKEVEFT